MLNDTAAQLTALHAEIEGLTTERDHYRVQNENLRQRCEDAELIAWAMLRYTRKALPYISPCIASNLRMAMFEWRTPPMNPWESCVSVRCVSKTINTIDLDCFPEAREILRDAMRGEGTR